MTQHIMNLLVGGWGAGIKGTSLIPIFQEIMTSVLKDREFPGAQRGQNCKMDPSLKQQLQTLVAMLQFRIIWSLLVI